MLYRKIKLQPLGFVLEMVTSKNNAENYLFVLIFLKYFRCNSENAGVLHCKLLLQALNKEIVLSDYALFSQVIF